MQLSEDQREWVQLARAIGLVIHGKWLNEKTYVVQFVSEDWADLDRAQQYHSLAELRELSITKEAA